MSILDRKKMWLFIALYSGCVSLGLALQIYCIFFSFETFVAPLNCQCNGKTLAK